MKEKIVQTAEFLMVGRVTAPCVKVDARNETVNLCPMLDVEKGCMSPAGIVVGETRKAACGEGKGDLVISSQKLSELICDTELTLV